MIKRNVKIYIFLFILLIVSVYSVGSVFAVFAYPEGRAESATDSLTAVLGNFGFKTDEDIAHMIADNVIESLNNKDSKLNAAIESRKNFANTIGNKDAWHTGGGLGSWVGFANINTEVLGTGADTDGWSYIIYYRDGADGNTYILYTTNCEITNENVENKDYVYPIYKTIMTRTSTTLADETIVYSDFVAGETKVGYSMSAYYSHSLTGSSFIQSPSWDPTYWYPGEPPTMTN